MPSKPSVFLEYTMINITFIGAGSTVFVRNVIGDSLRTPVLRDAEIALYDIDAERLKDSEIILSALNRNINDNRAHISCYLGEENWKAALKDATFVINAIQVGGYDPCTITDFEIPKKYGLRQTIADTLGIGGNVLNNGLISNLPANACVEVPCLVDGAGITPCRIGDLPPVLVAMNMTNINPQLLAIEAARTKKREAIYHAVMLDPHTSAELSSDDIRALCDELIEAHGKYMAMYK